MNPQEAIKPYNKADCYTTKHRETRVHTLQQSLPSASEGFECMIQDLIQK